MILEIQRQDNFDVMAVLDTAIHALFASGNTWMTGSSPVMTSVY